MAGGDVLTIFSDGISEAVDAGDAEFGEERICSVVSGCRDLPAAGIIDHIVSEVRRFAGDLPQRDDMTLVVVKRAAAG
jgi:sigma-B regulation protein RsbU (phosphoserine phosphatase)